MGHGLGGRKKVKRISLKVLPIGAWYHEGPSQPMSRLHFTDGA